MIKQYIVFDFSFVPVKWLYLSLFLSPGWGSCCSSLALPRFTPCDVWFFSICDTKLESNKVQWHPMSRVVHKICRYIACLNVDDLSLSTASTPTFHTVWSLIENKQLVGVTIDRLAFSDENSPEPKATLLDFQTSGREIAPPRSRTCVGSRHYGYFYLIFCILTYCLNIHPYRYGTETRSSFCLEMS